MAVEMAMVVVVVVVVIYGRPMTGHWDGTMRGTESSKDPSRSTRTAHSTACHPTNTFPTAARKEVPVAEEVSVVAAASLVVEKEEGTEGAVVAVATAGETVADMVEMAVAMVGATRGPIQAGGAAAVRAVEGAAVTAAVAMVGAAAAETEMEAAVTVATVATMVAVATVVLQGVMMAAAAVMAHIRIPHSSHLWSRTRRSWTLR